ncbi:MAG: hypothetical protein Fur0043_15560 [Anaerolineales bacterium]
MKKILLSVALVLAVILACSPLTLPPQASQPGVETIVAATMQSLLSSPMPQNPPLAETPTVFPPIFAGTPLQFANLSLTIPPGLAVGGSGVQIPPASGEEVEPWNITPGHLELTLTAYAIPNHFHQPRIFIFPAQAYAALHDGAANNILRLQTILANPSLPLTEDQIPFVPFFNAGAAFTAQMQVIPFQNGLGVRMLTQYGQAVAPANNHGLFYHFQGLTHDGQIYVIAVLPVSAPFLAADWEAPLPADGIPFPGYDNPDTVAFNDYYRQVIERLNTTPPEAFSPSLTLLDALVESLNITAP